MPKKAISLIFLLTFAAQAFSRQVIIVDFYANRAYFEKKCENKSRPVLHCGGKCQLIKKIKQEENKDQQNPERKTENKSETFYSSPAFVNPMNSASRNVAVFQAIINIGFPVDRTYSIFHPPATQL